MYEYKRNIMNCKMNSYITCVIKLAIECDK